MSEVTPVNTGRSPAVGWPTIDDLSKFAGVPVTDDALIWSLEGAIDYGSAVLGDRFLGDITESAFRACLDFAASIYTERIGQSDFTIEGYLGSTPMTRYRRVLLANRFTAFA